MVGLLEAFTVFCVVDDSETESQVIDTERASSLGLLVPAGLAGTTITFKVSDFEDGTFVALKDADGTTDSISISGQTTAFAVSSSELKPLSGYRFVKVVLSQAASGMKQFAFFCKY